MRLVPDPDMSIYTFCSIFLVTPMPLYIIFVLQERLPVLVWGLIISDDVRKCVVLQTQPLNHLKPVSYLNIVNLDRPCQAQSGDEDPSSHRSRESRRRDRPSEVGEADSGRRCEHKNLNPRHCCVCGIRHGLLCRSK